MLPIVHSIAPLVLIIVAGVVSGMGGLVSDATRKGLSDFCYFFGMPALLIRTIATAPASATDPHLIWVGYLAPITLVWIAGTLTAPRARAPHKSPAASIAMASAYGNVLMLGIPLALNQFGHAAATTVALVVLVHSPVLFLAAAIHSELAKHLVRFQPAGIALMANPSLPGTKTESLTVSVATAVREVVFDLATNPIILAIGAGLTLRFTGTDLPRTADVALTLLGQATLPCVLLAIGLGLTKFNLKGEIPVIGFIAVLKLVVLPLAAWFVTAIVLKLPPLEIATITLLSAMPTGANAFAFAAREGAAEASVSAAVAISTVASALTITATLVVLGNSN